MLGTIAVIDRLLKVEPAFRGPAGARYNLDGYGEKADGSFPFDGSGSAASGHSRRANGRTVRACGGKARRGGGAARDNRGADQSWRPHSRAGGDAAPIPDRELALGKPTGSAMPLVWAHGEYVKLLRSLKDGRVFDMSPHTMRRYLDKKRTACCRPWREDWL